MFKYLFGPVPSRRLGISLGIDLVPHKVCTLNCVYCECGPTTDLTLQRKEYIPYEKVIQEIGEYFQHNQAPDYITFSGSGEPTLNSKIGDVLTFIKQNIPRIPVALLTNGTLFSDPEVRRELLDADLVIPSLDAASDAVFRRINRPYRSLTIESYIDGLIQFRRECSAKYWLEVFIIPGLNDTEEELALLKQAILSIQPDRVQLNSLDRPGTVANIRKATREELERVADILQLENVEIISSADRRKKIQSYRQDTEAAILETIARRPCTLNDLCQILGLHENEVNKYLSVLEANHSVTTEKQDRGDFYLIPK